MVVLQKPIEIGVMTIYDEDGNTQLPADVKRAMDLSKGDRLKIVSEDGVARLYKIDEKGDVIL
jgi:hypothetical protein